MRALTRGNVGPYTAAQLAGRLAQGTGGVSCRFEVLDQNLGHIGWLSGVKAAKVSTNVDQAVKGSLTATLLPDPLLPIGGNSAVWPLTRYIKVWYRISMPNGDIVEWPEGVFLWTAPERDITGTGVEDWVVTLPDRLADLQFGGPGDIGFNFPAGTVVTDAIKATLYFAGFVKSTDPSDLGYSGIAPSQQQLGADLTWDVTQAAPQQPASPTGVLNEAGGASGSSGTNFLDILQFLHLSIGYYSPWVDADGRYMATPIPNIFQADTVKDYVAQKDGGMLKLPAKVQPPDMSIAVNRVFATSQGAGSGLFDYANADLDTFAAWYPLSHANIGRYIDATISSSNAASQDQLNTLAAGELISRALAFQAVEFNALPWPVHEPFDVLGFHVPGDSQFGTKQALHSRQFDLDLMPIGDNMHHVARRITWI